METNNKNKALARNLAMLAVGMVALSYASVPLYRLFCEVTGFGGTVRAADMASIPQATDRKMTVRFDAQTHNDLPWRFHPDQAKVDVKVGEQTLVSYTAENKASRSVTGNATFNVTPHKAGRYFSKIECFCFEEQTLTAHQKVHMPISFYIDPKITEDKNLSDVDTITLSYTFFEVKPD